MTLNRDGIGRAIEEFSQEGYCCSQIVAALALQQQKKTNWDFIRGMEGLRGGLGCSGDICGTLTGVVCLMGLYAGRGPVGEKPDPRLDPMVRELVSWFRKEIRNNYGGIKCEEITRKHPEGNLLRICRSIMLETYLQSTRILEAHGFNVDRGRDESLPNMLSESNT